MSFEKMSGKGAVFDAGVIVRKLPTPFCSAGLEERADGLSVNEANMQPACGLVAYQNLGGACIER